MRVEIDVRALIVIAVVMVTTSYISTLMQKYYPYRIGASSVYTENMLLSLGYKPWSKIWALDKLLPRFNPNISAYTKDMLTWPELF